MNAEQKELVKKIMELVLRLETETTYAVMFDYAGHCNMISISLRESKKEYETILFKTTFYCTGQLYSETKVVSIVDALEALLDTGEFQGSAIKNESIDVVVSKVMGTRQIYSI